jgi:hypothetical protein
MTGIVDILAVSMSGRAGVVRLSTWVSPSRWFGHSS